MGHLEMQAARMVGTATTPIEKIAAFADRSGMALSVIEPGGGKFLHVNDRTRSLYPFHDFNDTGFSDWIMSCVQQRRSSNLAAYLDTAQWTHRTREIYDRNDLVEFTTVHADSGARCHVIHTRGPDGVWIQLRALQGEMPKLEAGNLNEHLGCALLTPNSIAEMVRRANYGDSLPVGQAIELIPVAAAICTDRGSLAFANRSMVSLLEQWDCFRLIEGRLVTSDEDDTMILQGLIQNHARSGGNALPSLHQIRRRRGASLIVSVEALKHEAGALRGLEPMSLVLVVEPDQSPSIDPQWLQTIYGLSPAQAEVTLLIASGLSGKEVARVRNVSPGTIKNQLTAIYMKTGANSDAGLQMVIANLAKLRLLNQPRPQAGLNWGHNQVSAR